MFFMSSSQHSVINVSSDINYTFQMTDGEYKDAWKLASLACPRVRLSTPLAVGDLCGPTALWLSLIHPLSAAGPRWVCAGSVHDLCALQATCSCHVITHRQHRPRIASPLASSFSPPLHLSPPRLSPFPDLLHREIGLAQSVLSPAAITPFCAPTAAPPRARGRGRAVGACVQIAVTCAGDVTVCGVIKV